MLYSIERIAEALLNERHHQLSSEEEWESHLAKFFPCCPLCGSDRIEIDIAFGRRYDYITCFDCKAKWEVDWKGEDFLVQYVKLVDLDTNKEGEEHLLNELSLNFWRKMALRKQRAGPRKEQAREKEIIREKEVIVKIRCPYCHKLYDETLDKCPNCGASR